MEDTYSDLGIDMTARGKIARMDHNLKEEGLNEVELLLNIDQI
jgi:hypothetical protein